MKDLKPFIFLLVISIIILIRLLYRDVTYLNGELIYYSEDPVVFYIEVMFMLGVAIYSIYRIVLRVKESN